MPEVKDLQHKHAQLITRYREKRAEMTESDKDFSKEDSVQLNALLDEAEALQETIESIQRADERLTAAETWSQELDYNPVLRGKEGSTKETEKSDAIKRWERYLMTGDTTGFMRPAQIRADIQVDTDVGGGYVIVPGEVVGPFLEEIDDNVFIRQMATKFTIGIGQEFTMPMREEDVEDAEWTSELGQVTFSETQELGNRMMRPNRLVKGIKTSADSEMAPGMDVASYWNERLKIRIVRTFEKNYLNGNGVNQPLGMLINTGDYAIPTSQDVVTQETGGELAAKDIINTYYHLKGHYSRDAVWMASRPVIRQMRLIANTTGDLMWQPGLTAGEPPLLETRPVITSEFMPSAFTTGTYAAIFADFKWYYIVDSLQMRVQRLVEKYAETNQIGYIVRQYGDGQPVMNEAFARLKWK